MPILRFDVTVSQQPSKLAAARRALSGRNVPLRRSLTSEMTFTATINRSRLARVKGCGKKATFTGLRQTKERASEESPRKSERMGEREKERQRETKRDVAGGY